MNKLTDKQYQRLVSRYNADPNNVTVCRALLAEYKVRGYTDAAAKLAAWIQTLPATPPRQSLSARLNKYKIESSTSMAVWIVACLMVVTLGVMMLINDTIRSLVLFFGITAIILGISSLPCIIAFWRKIQGVYGIGIMTIAFPIFFSISMYLLRKDIPMLFVSIVDIFSYTILTLSWWVALIWSVSAAKNGSKNL